MNNQDTKIGHTEKNTVLSKYPLANSPTTGPELQEA